MFNPQTLDVHLFYSVQSIQSISAQYVSIDWFNSLQLASSGALKDLPWFKMVSPSKKETNVISSIMRPS